MLSSNGFVPSTTERNGIETLTVIVPDHALQEIADTPHVVVVVLQETDTTALALVHHVVAPVLALHDVLLDVLLETDMNHHRTALLHLLSLKRLASPL